jgi:hypothetical protein
MMQLIFATEILLLFSIIPTNIHEFVPSQHVFKYSITNTRMALIFSTIPKQQSPLPHYSGIDNVPCITSVAHTNCHEVRSFSTAMQLQTVQVRHNIIISLRTLGLLKLLLRCWSNNWEVTDPTVLMKWKWLYLNGSKCKRSISATTEFLNSCQSGSKISVCKQRNTPSNSTVMPYNTLLQVSVRTNHHQELRSHWEKHKKRFYFIRNFVVIVTYKYEEYSSL